MKFFVTMLNQDPVEQEFNKILQRNHRTIIYFYPKDDTPWCTTEARDFSDAYILFVQHHISVYGVSKDSDSSHCNFITKYGLSIPLISDPDLILHKKFGAWWEKNIHGRAVKWTIRSTVLLDQDGNIMKQRPHVKADGHVARIIEELELK